MTKANPCLPAGRPAPQAQFVILFHMGRVIVDVRETGEYALGHVEEALNIPLSELMNNPKRLGEIPKDSQVILYCNSGNRSGVAKNMLEAMGYTNVVNGINADRVAAHFGV